MQRLFFVILCVSLLFACQDKSVSSKKPGSEESALKSAPAQVYFQGNYTEAVLKEICEAKSKILVQARSSVSAPIAGALVEAHKEGVKVEASVGKIFGRSKPGTEAYLANGGIPVYFSQRTKFSNETMVIDGKIVITGSFDPGKEEGDTGHLTVIKSPELADAYIENWKKGKQNARLYQAKAKSVPAQRTRYKRKP